MIAIFSLVALFQQGPFQGATTPPGGDTVGYWQQRVHYQITATLDESASALHATATLTYVNNSPDTLHEMFFHQYLNAFRPGSKWSAVDEHENRVRFQYLRDPNYGYERFTEAPVVGGVPVLVDYPGAPDSTVAHFKLPRPLAPHDSIQIHVAWDARPSTVPRRQGRRGRTYDFAQWYPKVAVYDRRGWEPNPLVPAGELYGEYGDYDVTMVVRDDQVLASTGVPVAGDPGWSRVSRTGAPYLASNAYGAFAPPQAPVPAGDRAVTFSAHDVHMFAWSASPDYIYEGTTYVRHAPPTHFKTWDTVAVNVLYKPGDDTSWANGKALERTVSALKWLESIWGPYGYPAITNVHRIEGGGTEFPMMIMDGGAGEGLILHELGHVYTYGILGNNEWRSGWMDEGLTDYQSAWAQGLTPQDRRTHPPIPPRLAEGYRVNATQVPPVDSAYLAQQLLDLNGRAQPIGTPAYDFSEFGIYNQMIYDRAKVMYGQLRELMGDSVFLRFTHAYYDRWAFKHVDELAMRTSAEQAYGHPLGWFFGEWVHGTGLMDYSVKSYAVRTDGSRFETIVHVVREGDIRHPMPVGVLTPSGWTFGRADPLIDEQDVHIVTNDAPIRVELDPYHATWDWDWRNNQPSAMLLGVRAPSAVFNWPWLNQADRAKTIVGLSPDAWYTNPQGPLVGVRAKTSYLSSVDLYDAGLGFSARNPHDTLGRSPNFATRAQVWLRGENVYLPGMNRPLMGFGGGVNWLDGLFKADLYKKWDLSPFIYTPGPAISAKVYATVAIPSDSMLLPEQWSNVTVGEVGGTGSYRTVVTEDSQSVALHGALALGDASANSVSGGSHSGGYVRAEGSVSAIRSLVGTESQIHVRLYGGTARGAPMQRAIFASSQDPFETFDNDLFRGRGALLKQDGINYLPVGGAGLRGYAFDTPLDGVVAGNGEFVQRLVSAKGDWGRGSIALSIFGDAGFASSRTLALTNSLMSDAGAGLIARGHLYDRDLYVRLDAPVFVNQAGFAGGRGLGGSGSFAPRWVITVGDLY